jgi:hypothetical protein
VATTGGSERKPAKAGKRSSARSGGEPPEAARTRGATRTPEAEELARAALAVVGAHPGITPTKLRAALPRELRPHASLVVEAARELASRGRLGRFAKGATERFFERDPMELLTLNVPPLLRERGPLELGALRREVDRLGLGVVLPIWLRAAQRERLVFPHGPARGKRDKRFGARPDVAGALGKVVRSLEAVARELTAHGVEPHELLAVLSDALGARAKTRTAKSTEETEPDEAAQASARALVREALDALAARHREGAVVLVTDLRAATPGLDKARFDEAVLGLAAEGRVALHHHDYASSLAPAERDALVRDGAVHYVAIAPRGRAERAEREP